MSPPQLSPPTPRPARHPIHDALAAAFEVTPEGRRTVVETMLEGHVRQAASYWLYIALAMGIATLGLVLGSTGVVIGAMLISPLMGPIVGLGMGLAVGSPLLVIRSLVRVAGSIVVVVAAATMITLGLPFQEITTEIAARTSPTVLDLLVAIGCALAAAFTTMRPTSDTTSTAAGTAIGISLVPPLCVVGFGLGTRDTHIASGAGLLFTANLCAILLFATLTFWAFGFGDVDVLVLERERAPSDRLTHRVAGFVRTAFGSRYSPLLRLLMPLVLVAAVYLPLRRALAEVSWEVRVRTELQQLLAELPLASSAVRSQLVIEGHNVHARLVVVAGAEQAAELQKTLESRAAVIAGVEPSIEVLAVPDVAALREATRARAPVTPDAPPVPDMPELRRRLASGLGRAWPARAAGPLIAVRVDVTADVPAVELVHLGSPLGPAAQPLLATALSDAVGFQVHLRELAVPAAETAAPPGSAARWLPAFVRSVAWVDQFDGLFACVTAPPPPAAKPHTATSKPPTDPDAAEREIVDAQIALTRRGAFGISTGEHWAVRLQQQPCTPPPPDPDPDAGAPTSPSDGGPDAGPPSDGGAPPASSSASDAGEGPSPATGTPDASAP
jgi:uncharacterized hydrophobic protein (TIGR00271 family)